MERTIHFDSASEADRLLAPTTSFFGKMQKELCIDCTCRDNWLKVTADDEETLDHAESFVHLLRHALNQGMDLRGSVRPYILFHFLEGNEADIREMLDTRIDVMTGKRSVFTKTLGQAHYLREISKQDVTFGIGPAGTGKTYLAMAMAVHALLQGEVNRIILTRPAVEAGEALGFLPGDLQQKILPYLRPLYDALHDMMDAGTIEQMIERGVIEVAPLAYMRGRTLNQSFIILDEAQNTTEEQMLMFLTRIGFDSRCVVNGDPSQIDLPKNKRSGIREALHALEKTKGIAICRLGEEDVVRHALVQRIIRAYRTARDLSSSSTLTTPTPTA